MPSHPSVDIARRHAALLRQTAVRHQPFKRFLIDIAWYTRRDRELHSVRQQHIRTWAVHLRQRHINRTSWGGAYQQFIQSSCAKKEFEPPERTWPARTHYLPASMHNSKLVNKIRQTKRGSLLIALTIHLLQYFDKSWPDQRHCRRYNVTELE